MKSPTQEATIICLGVCPEPGQEVGGQEPLTEILLNIIVNLHVLEHVVVILIQSFTCM